MVPFLLAMLLWAQSPRPSIALIDTSVIVVPELAESSGLAPSARHAGRFWSINDSGNRPLLFGLDSTGADRGFVRVRGAALVDWEDLASGPCPKRAGNCLFIADIGDNYVRRGHVVIYVVPEPDAPTNPSDTLREVVVSDTIQLRYPDGRHDAEALAVTGDRWIAVITKDRSDPAKLYRAPLDSTGHGRTFEYMGELPIAVGMVRGRLVTGAAVSPDGQWLAARTYVSIHLFRLLPGARLESLLPRSGIVIPVVETQGEAIAFDRNDRLTLTSERGQANHGILTRLAVSGLPAQ